MRCQHIIGTGRRCAEQRPEWLWLAQNGDTLQYLCTSHIRCGQLRVRATAMRNWLAMAGDLDDDLPAPRL